MSTINNTVLRMPAVMQTVGLSKATIYRLISKGLFPMPVKIGMAAVGWRATDINRFVETGIQAQAK